MQFEKNFPQNSAYSKEAKGDFCILTDELNQYMI